MVSKSQELYEKWEENGGNLQDYDFPREVTDDRSRTKWFRSGVVRWRNLQDSKEHVVREKREALDEQTSHIRWKHTSTSTWMHLESGTSVLVGEPVGFKAYVTISGQQLTVGEYHVSASIDEVIKWAVEWMEAHPNGYQED